MSRGEHALTEDPQLAARSLASLFLAGATIGLVSLLLPHPSRADVGGLYSNVGIAYAGAAGLYVAAPRVRGWMIHTALVIGSLLVTRAVLLSHDPVSFYAVWYVWVGLFAFYFCSRLAAAAHVAFAALLYAATLLHQVPNSPVARWLTTVATLVVAGAFIDSLVRRARQQAAAASASALGMERVTELAHELAAIADGDTARRALCRGAARVTRADAVLFWEPSANGAGLRLTADGGPAAADLADIRMPEGAGTALQAGRPVCTVVTADGESIVICADTDADAEERKPRLWYPVVQQDHVVAVLDLSWTDRGAANAPIVSLSKLLAAEAAVTLQRVALVAELERIARTDELTGLPNRRAWQEQLSREMARTARSGESLSVAMLDLDHFKAYNDRHGHQAGDRLLKRSASTWTSHLRPSDILARYGGEEFALALPGCTPGEARASVERLRHTMPDGRTCSAGIAHWDGVEPPSELLERADRALYAAKRSGRNQTADADADTDADAEAEAEAEAGAAADADAGAAQSRAPARGGSRYGRDSATGWRP